MMKRSKASKYLKNPTYPIQIDRDRSVAGLLSKMEATSFQGRNLAKMNAAGVKIVLGTDGNVPWSHFVEMEDMVAGGMTKSNLIGLVGGYPIPEVNRLMHAFMDEHTFEVDRIKKQPPDALVTCDECGRLLVR